MAASMSKTSSFRQVRIQSLLNIFLFIVLCILVYNYRKISVANNEFLSYENVLKNENELLQKQIKTCYHGLDGSKSRSIVLDQRIHELTNKLSSAESIGKTGQEQLGQLSRDFEHTKEALQSTANQLNINLDNCHAKNLRLSDKFEELETNSSQLNEIHNLAMEEIAQLRQELVQLKNMYSLNQDLSDVDTGSLNVGQKLQQQAGPSWNTNAIVRRSGNWPGKAGRQQSYFHVEAADHRSERSVQLAPPSWKVPEQFPQNVAGPGDLDPAQELMGPLDNPGTEQPKIGGYLDDQADAQRVAIPGQLDAVGYPGEEGIALHLDNNHGDYADDLKYQNGIEDAGVDAVNKIGEEPLAQVYPNDLDSERDEEDDDKEEEDGIRSI